VRGFDYTALHWADKQKPLPEVAGEFGMFPEAIHSPPLVPETIDQEAPLPAAEMMSNDGETARLIERFTVEEHFLRVEYVSARLPERRTRQRAPEISA